MSKISSFQEAAGVFLAQGASKNVPQQTIDDYKDRKLVLRDAVKYVRQEITVGGRVELLNSSTKKLAGITNLDANKLSDRQNLIISAIALGYGANIAAGKEAAVDYNTTIPVGIRNADLEVKQNGRVIISMPAADAFNQGTGANVSDKYRELSALAFLQEGQEFSIDLVFAAGAVGGGTHDYVEVSLRGLETAAR